MSAGNLVKSCIAITQLNRAIREDLDEINHKRELVQSIKNVIASAEIDAMRNCHPIRYVIAQAESERALVNAKVVPCIAIFTAQDQGMFIAWERGSKIPLTAKLFVSLKNAEAFIASTRGRSILEATITTGNMLYIIPVLNDTTYVASGLFIEQLR